MSFAYPYALALFLPLFYAAWRMLRASRGTGLKFSAVARIGKVRTTWRYYAAALAPWLTLAALALLVVASSRPRIPLGKNRKNVDSIAIAMVADVSGSMSTLDLTPEGMKYSKDTTRLAFVKRVFADFVSRRPDDLIGLVTFGTYASARSPLTADHESLLKVLEGVEIPMGDGEAETAVGDGLSVALLRLKDAKLKSKIVILLSDGMSNIGEREGAVEPSVAADSAAKMGIKVYTIGVGTSSRIAPRLFVDMYGREIIRNSQTGFDEAQLKEIAAKTDGMYFGVNDKEALEAALAEIDQLETTSIEAMEWNRWDEYFPHFLSGGTALFLVALCLSMLGARRLV